MTVEQLTGLYGYNTWANSLLLDAAEALTAEERGRDMRASFGSLEGTLIHILWGERGWLRYWQTGEFVPRPVASEYADLASLRAAWAIHEEFYTGYLGRLTQADLDGPRRKDDTDYTLGELVQHALNHSTFHRGQVTLLLRQLGHVPPSTDFQDYLALARSLRDA